MDNIDRLLAELKAKHHPSSNTSPPQEPAPAPLQSLDDLLSHLAEGTKQVVRHQLSQRSAAPSPPITKSILGIQSSATIDPLLTQLESESQRQEQATQEKQRRLNELQAKRRADLAKQAQQWLKTLNSSSEEGVWFEEFACGYGSRLEAAIDYLEALQTVERESRPF